MQKHTLIAIAVVLVTLLSSGSAGAKSSSAIACNLTEYAVTAVEVYLASNGNLNQPQWLRDYVVDKTAEKYPDRRPQIAAAVDKWLPLLQVQAQDAQQPLWTDAKHPQVKLIPKQLRDTWEVIFDSAISTAEDKPAVKMTEE